MKSRQACSFLLIMAVLTLYNCGVHAQQGGKSGENAQKIAFLDAMVTRDKPVNLDGNSIEDAIAKLRLNYGCIISVEMIEYTKEDTTSRGNICCLDRRRPVSDRSFSNLTVRQVLDELVEIDPGYQWKVYDGKYVVLEPRTAKNGGREKSILDTIVSLSTDNVSLNSLLGPYEHPFGQELFYSHRLCFYTISMGRNPGLGGIRISLHLENVTLRDAFNAIVAEAEKATGDRFRWLIKGLRHDSIDLDGNIVTTRDFTFQRITKERLELTTNPDS
jgi:hypothetical protein